MDILRGQAMTTPDGLVLDVFEFSDEEGFCTECGRRDRRHLRGCSNKWSPARSTSRRCSRASERSLRYRRRVRRPPVVHFDNEHSRKYTVLEIVADDAPGLLLPDHAACISAQGCDRRTWR